MDATPPEDLVDSVLRRTSGPPCTRACELLCDLVDAALEEPDAELVRMHLLACEECGSTARALGGLRHDLPAMQGIEPDRAFVDDVLARTSRSLRRRLAAGCRSL